MPPKAKFTRDIIIQAGLSIVRENGIEALTARALGAKLGSSARPIFTVFQSMDEVQAEVKESAKSIYDEYVRKGLEQELAFKGVGTQYIVFAMQEPKLFQLLLCQSKSSPQSRQCNAYYRRQLRRHFVICSKRISFVQEYGGAAIPPLVDLHTWHSGALRNKYVYIYPRRNQQDDFAGI